MDLNDPRNGVPGLPDEPADSVPLLDNDGGTMPLPRVQRQPLVPEGTGAAKAVRVIQLVAGDYLVTLNPVDGSEITTCPPESRPAPVRRSPQDRATVREAARPPAPAGPRGPELPLLEREEERERLARLLSRGRSVRVTGPSGAGRSVLLDAVAEACVGLAPDGVIRLSGYRRTPSDLLQELYTAVYETAEPEPGYRPDRPHLLDLLRDVGAVVVVDDLEFGGAGLEDLLAAAPECAFLMSATPDVAAPATDSPVEEIFLPGLTRIACLELLERAVERPLEDEEAAWAADLWFESEGLPLRFVQAGALLRRRDTQGIEALQGDEPVWDRPESILDDAGDSAGQAPDDEVAAVPAGHIPLPPLAESAAPAVLLASSMGESAREALRFAVALDGEIPHQAHLPALVGDTHGDAALSALVNAGLAVPVAAHYRLAAGVRQQLVAYEESAGAKAHTAAQHYAWWAGHPSVTPDRVAAEAEAILAALSACRDGGHASAAVLLARTASPVFAAALHWSAWERTLRIGQEAARLAGEVAEEAYFHHELGVLALCTGSLDRARTELEASIALRGALADRQGTTVGRRTLALVVDRSGGPAPLTTPAGVESPGAGSDASRLPGKRYGDGPATVISKRLTLSGPGSVLAGPRRLALTASRRNLIAAGAGALLAAVLGTIVTLGTTANDGDTNTPMNIKPVESAQQNEADNNLPAASDTAGSTQRPSPSDSGTTPGVTTPPAVPGGMGSTTTEPGTSTSSTSKGSKTPRPSTSRSSTPPSTSSSTPASPPASSSSASPSASPSASVSTSASESVSSGPITTTDPAAPSESTSESGTIL